MDFINRSKLNELRIHELRDFARSVGVKSPTSKKKEELIEEALLILRGEAEPYVNKTKQGRPVKSSGFVLEDVYNLFLTEDVLTSGFEETENNFEYNVDYDFEGKQAFFVNSPKAAYNESNENNTFNKEKTVLVSGFLDVHKQNYGVIRVKGFRPTKNDVYVQSNLIIKHNLKSGDYVVGKAVELQQDKPRVLVEVEKVNNTPAEDTNTLESIFQKSYEEYGYNELTFKINEISAFNNVVGNSFFEGSRNFIYKTGFDYETQVVTNKQLAKQGYKVFSLYLNAMPEHKCIKEDGFVIDCVPFNVSEKTVIMAVNMLVKCAKRALENGEKVLVVVNNFSHLINAVNVDNSKTYDKALRKETVHFIKNFLSIAKSADNAGSVSVFVVDDLNVEEEILDFYKFDLFKFFNTLQEINENNEIIELEI